ncbi:MAG TPA: hypothetical protein VN670_03800 [Acidobacteriaceae bacterium]|nr:hypothetical protein [Acidobacteriaceae bacterium]
MRKRTWISLAVVALIIAALVVVVALRKKAPPEVARLLPEADAIVYFNVKPLRTLTRFDQHPVAHDTDYQAFINATGIEFERDLDQAAFAIHRMADPNGPNGPVAYSEVFQGHFDGTRLTGYLSTRGHQVESYAGHDIYAISNDGRTVRIAILGYDMVAVSNAPTPEQIHSMIDRYHSAASPFSGDTLLSRYYSDVPLLSEAWGIGALGLPLASGQQFHLFGLPLPVPVDATFIASIRYLGTIHLRLEEIAASPEDAKRSADLAKVVLRLLRATQISNAQDASAQDWAALLRSVVVEQKANRAVVRAEVPVRLVRSLLLESKAAPAATAGVPTETNP